MLAPPAGELWPRFRAIGPPLAGRSIGSRGALSHESGEGHFSESDSGPHAAFEAPRVEAPREMGGFFVVFGAWGRVAGRAAATRAARGMVL